MYKLKKIRIEGMHNVSDKTYDLSDFTYFYGNNGAGKSTILQAIQLALLGYIPGTGKTNSAIFTHSNANIMRVTLTIETDSVNIELMREYKSAGKTVKYDCIIPDNFDVNKLLGGLELPIFDFGEFNNLTANKLKDWFINFLPKPENELDIKKEIESITNKLCVLDRNFVTDVINYAVNLFNTAEDKVEAIRKLNDYLKNTLSFKKTELQRTESTVQTLVFNEDIDSLYTNPEELQSEITEIRSKVLNAQDLNAKLSTKSKLEQRLNDYISTYGPFNEGVNSDVRILGNNKEIDELLQSVHSLNLEIMDIDAHLTELNTNRAVLCNEIKTKQNIIDKGGICPYTSVVCDSIVNLIDQLKSEINSANDKISEIDSDIKKENARKSEISISINSNNQRINELTNSNKSIMGGYKVYTQTLKDINELNVPEEVTVDSINQNIIDWNSRLDEINDILIKLEANKKYTELYEKLSSEKMKINENIIILKELVKLTDMNGLQSRIMNAPFVELEDTVTKYLNICWNKPNIEAKFNIDGGANNFNFGIVDDIGYIPFDTLSSGEKCIYTLALILSLIESSNGDMKVVLIDDLFDHLDSENYTNLFNGLTKMGDIQFVFAGVEAPSPVHCNTIHTVDVTYE